MIDYNVTKHPLDLSKYKDYNIPQEYFAFTIYFEGIGQMDCDNIEYEYHSQGYKIYHTELSRSTGDLFNYTLIMAKSSTYTF